ncbi:MAG: hypothetical protein JWN66_3837 [Sphingomonas bacterium]|uniref:hypothetical protein n=1 Tax=Sphingomonas bacterium TaxID=1895847 RepID=UPI002610D846|nr:hypothetical protein [Sphingomonas bacterium]MDB5706721.1 hypothetical protein [Sphingomonas bacterium]
MRERWIKPQGVRSLALKAFSAIGIAASLSVPATPTNAQERRTTPQMKALAPGAANRVIQDDLLSILEPSGRIHAPMSRVLPNAKLVTRSMGQNMRVSAAAMP